MTQPDSAVAAVRRLLGPIADPLIRHFCTSDLQRIADALLEQERQHAPAMLIYEEYGFRVSPARTYSLTLDSLGLNDLAAHVRRTFPLGTQYTSRGPRQPVHF